MLSNDLFVRHVSEALQKQQMVVFGARCSVRYSGRAESFLPFGDRLIVIKTDGTMLVHQPNGAAPVNYMKDRTTHRVYADEELVKMKSQNLILKEFMEVMIDQVHFLHTQYMDDAEKIVLQGSERDMADMIMKNPGLIESGFVPVSQEEQTKYGYIDVMGNDKDGTLVIIECKRYSVGLSAVQQVRRYVEKIKQSKGLDKVRGILAAPKITPNAEKMLLDWGFEYKRVEPPKYLEQFNKNQMSIGEFLNN
ncbi:endonuclease NucS [Candidatus Woesearchaeota archaeon]|nr:endonuclease NucS [Candidatus Woesearchaeota archaeon]